MLVLSKKNYTVLYYYDISVRYPGHIRVPAAAGNAKAGIWLIPIADERVGVQVKL